MFVRLKPYHVDANVVCCKKIEGGERHLNHCFQWYNRKFQLLNPLVTVAEIIYKGKPLEKQQGDIPIQ